MDYLHKCKKRKFDAMRFQFKTDYNDDINIFKDRYHLFWYLLLAAALIALPFVLGDYYVSQAIYILIFSIAGLGLMVLVGHTGLVSLGHAAFLAAGAYSCINLEQLGVPFIFALPLAGLFAGVFGAVITIPVLRLTGIYLAIGTMALAVIIEDIIVLAEPVTGGVAGLSVDSIKLFGDWTGSKAFDVDLYGTPFKFYFLCLFVTLMVTLLMINLLRSSTGRAFHAIRDSEVSARAMGINVTGYKALSFGISCFITGLAGGLLAHYLGHINHEAFLILVSIELLMIVVIGGMGSIHGAFFGAFVFGMLPVSVTIFIETFGAPLGITSSTFPGLSTGIFAALLVSFILLEPFGFYGMWLKIRTYFQLFPLYRKDMFKRQKSYLKTERMR
jgi:branched-chain amino acid transport system permease protein